MLENQKHIKLLEPHSAAFQLVDLKELTYLSYMGLNICLSSFPEVCDLECSVAGESVMYTLGVT